MKLHKDESPEDCGHGEPAPMSEGKPSIWWPIAIVGGLIAFMISALSGCAQVSETVGEYRDTHEAVVAFEIRGGMAWVGFGIRKAGRAAEIEVIEGEKPFAIQPSK